WQRTPRRAHPARARLGRVVLEKLTEREACAYRARLGRFEASFKPFALIHATDGYPCQNPMLHLRDVEKSYSRADQTLLACAVDQLDIDAGEQVALIGRSGTGKTTVLHILAGILRPDRGEVDVAGARLNKLGEAARDRHRGRNIGMVYQTFNLLQPF